MSLTFHEEMGRVGEDVTMILARKLLLWNLSFTARRPRIMNVKLNETISESLSVFDPKYAVVLSGQTERQPELTCKNCAICDLIVLSH